MFEKLHFFHNLVKLYIEQRHQKKIPSCLSPKFYGHHQDLVNYYRISVTLMILDMFRML